MQRGGIALDPRQERATGIIAAPGAQRIRGRGHPVAFLQKAEGEAVAGFSFRGPQVGGYRRRGRRWRHQGNGVRLAAGRRLAGKGEARGARLDDELAGGGGGGGVRAVRGIHPERQRQAPRRDVVKLGVLQGFAPPAPQVARLTIGLPPHEGGVERRVGREQGPRHAALRLGEVDQVAAGRKVAGPRLGGLAIR